MLRFASAFALVSLSVMPSLAQDRTPPAGSYRALSVPTYVAPAIPGYDDYATPGLRQGRSEAIGRHVERRVAR